MKVNRYPGESSTVEKEVFAKKTVDRRPQWMKDSEAKLKARDLAKSGLAVKQSSSSQLQRLYNGVTHPDGGVLGEIGKWWPRGSDGKLVSREEAFQLDAYPLMSGKAAPWGIMQGDTCGVRVNIGKVGFQEIVQEPRKYKYKDRDGNPITAAEAWRQAEVTDEQDYQLQKAIGLCDILETVEMVKRVLQWQECEVEKVEQLFAMIRGETA